MGKGDKKSRRGKIILGTFGVRRPRKKADKGNKAVQPAEKEIIERKPPREKKEAPVAKEPKPVKPVKEETEPMVKEVKTEKEVVKPEPKAKAANEHADTEPATEAAGLVGLKDKQAATPVKQPKEKKAAKPKMEKKS